MRLGALVVTLMLAGCGAAEDLVALESKEATKGVWEPETVCLRTCQAAGYEAGEWCSCEGYATLPCVCRPPEASACSRPGCAVP